eukprot:m.178875 g.178875  ORF g.178875 m.178875 type:complete len:294 (+) comp10451_c0_seq5:4437-5318(+)
MPSRTASVLIVLLAAAVGYVQWTLRFDPAELRGQRVVVFGASTGIGREVALQYCRAGAQVALVARRKQVLDEVAAACTAAGGVGHALAADLGNAAECRRVVHASVEAFGGGLDTIILNHVLGQWQWWGELAADTSEAPAVVERLFQVNTFGYIYLATEALPFLRESKGRIAVVSSAAGKFGLPKVAVYSATKHALHGFFNSLRHELVFSGDEVSITVAVLGAVETENMRTNTRGELDHMPAIAASEAAEAIIRGTAQRVRELYCPWLSLQPVVLLYEWMPGVFDWIFRATTAS